MNFRYGTDEEFTFNVGKDVAYNGKCFRIMQRIVFNNGVKKYLLQCCDCKHDCQQVQLDVTSADDSTLLSEVTCEQVLTDVWPCVPFDGTIDLTANYIRNQVFSRCNVENEAIDMKLNDNGDFVLSFNGTEYTKPNPN